jgi:NADH dehydrogenase [ubiquinone] 1 alpha subcomplex assembly factor 7
MTLQSQLIKQIALNGPMSVADYMTECLLHPKFGYYATRDPFGAQGDFITAPEISQMFGELIGLCLAQSWLDQGAPEAFTLAELGPGRGTLMADILRATRAVKGFHAAAKIHLVEASTLLRKKQKAALDGYKVHWHDTVETLPNAPLYLVANEFFDALPIRQYVRQGKDWCERRVGAEAGQLQFGLTEPTAQPALEHRLSDTRDGDLVELCPLGASVAQTLGRKIQQAGGVALIIDYGDWRSLGDTLQALRNHSFVDPLESPGSSDLTTHVDFEALALAAECAHTRLTAQGTFLERLGIAARAQTLAANLNGDALKTHLDAYRRLTDATEMGTLFKVIALYPTEATPPAGFEP